MDGVKIEKLEKGELDNLSLEVWADRETVKELAASTNTGKKLRQELENGDIRYREHGLINTIKFSVVRLFL